MPMARVFRISAHVALFVVALFGFFFGLGVGLAQSSLYGSLLWVAAGRDLCGEPVVDGQGFQPGLMTSWSFPAVAITSGGPCAVAECPSLGTPGTYSQASRQAAASCRCRTRRSFLGSRVPGRIPRFRLVSGPQCSAIRCRHRLVNLA